MAKEKQETQSVKLTLTCERCKTKGIVEQGQLWRAGNHPDFGNHVPVPSELFSSDRGFGLRFNEDKYREESLLCLSCYEVYLNIKEDLLKEVNRKMLDFLGNEFYKP